MADMKDAGFNKKSTTINHISNLEKIEEHEIVWIEGANFKCLVDKQISALYVGGKGIVVDQEALVVINLVCKMNSKKRDRIHSKIVLAGKNPDISITSLKKIEYPQ